MSGVFIWLVAQWEHDRRPLIYFAFLQLGLAIWLVGTEAGAADVWILKSNDDDLLHNYLLRYVYWSGLALGGAFAVRDFREKARQLQPVTARDRVRALISRLIAVSVLVATIYGATLMVGRMTHGYASIGLDSRGWEAWFGALEGLLPFCLYATLSLLPVSPGGAFRLLFVVGVMLGNSPVWLSLLAVVLAIWELYGLEHDPDTPVRPRRLWPCVAALGVFGVSVDSCSHQWQDDIHGRHYWSHWTVAEELETLVQEGELDSAWFRVDAANPSLPYERSRSRSVDLRMELEGSPRRRAEWRVLRLSDDGDLEVLRRPMGRGEDRAPDLHRYGGESGLGFSDEAWIERRDDGYWVVEPGRDTVFRMPFVGQSWPPRLDRIELPNNDVFEAFAGRTYMTVWPHSLPEEVLQGDWRELPGATRFAGRRAAYTWTPEAGWIERETKARPTRYLEAEPIAESRRVIRLRSDDGESLAEVALDVRSRSFPSRYGVLTTIGRPVWMPLATLFVGPETLPRADRWVDQDPSAVLVPLLMTAFCMWLAYQVLTRPWADQRRIRFWLAAILFGGPWVAAIGNVFEDERAHGAPARGPLRAPRLRLRSNTARDLQEVSA